MEPDPHAWSSQPPAPPIETVTQPGIGTWVPPRKPTPWRDLGRKLLAPFAAVFYLLAKFKFLLFALKGIKFFGLFASMAVSIWAYSLLWGWSFAAGFVVLIFVHEMGHVLELRRQGVRASAPMFIPFLGAMVAMKEMPANALAEAKVGLAGPLLGSLGALATYELGVSRHSDFLLALAYTAAFLNLFNLIPLTPFDGGRAMAAVTPWMWFVGIAALVAFAVFVSFNPIILVFALFGVLDVWRRFRSRSAQPGYYDISLASRLGVLGVYLGLAAGLVWIMDVAHIAT